MAMIYLFQRIIQNNFQWTRPSPGRIGPSGEGEYVQKNGFGHEDWNFNKSHLIGGQIYGYCYYRPNKEKQKEKFNIAFAIYMNKKWYLTGFYLDTVFVKEPPVDQNVLKRKMQDLLQLGTSLAKIWSDLPEVQFLKKLQEEAQWLKWSVSPENAIRAEQPVEIPKGVFNTKNYHIVTPTEIDKKVFDSLFGLAQEQVAFDDYAYDAEFPEGREVEIRHKARERNQAVVKAAKDIFKKMHGGLYCQACGFDFCSKYGDIGIDYIEGHHVLPISDLTSATKTRVEDIALVCSNCHRMLHRRRPWLDLSQLKMLLKTTT
jgi:predicted HNH restriction endonuclease